jgi:hypothetical protein
MSGGLAPTAKFDNNGVIPVLLFVALLLPAINGDIKGLGSEFKELLLPRRALPGLLGPNRGLAPTPPFCFDRFIWRHKSGLSRWKHSWR